MLLILFSEKNLRIVVVYFLPTLSKNPPGIPPPLLPPQIHLRHTVMLPPPPTTWEGLWRLGGGCLHGLSPPPPF
jgi:hypothetical protein